ncbi:MAG: hypothetical protein OEY49_10390 [Candidatus Heimdallarchaeota archaeon]|nr:hypothetical protein [Candidatus Heimdallarchaeota archaeon]
MFEPWDVNHDKKDPYLLQTNIDELELENFCNLINRFRVVELDKIGEIMNKINDPNLLLNIILRLKRSIHIQLMIYRYFEQIVDYLPDYKQNMIQNLLSLKFNNNTNSLVRHPISIEIIKVIFDKHPTCGYILGNLKKSVPRSTDCANGTRRINYFTHIDLYRLKSIALFFSPDVLINELPIESYNLELFNLIISFSTNVKYLIFQRLLIDEPSKQGILSRRIDELDNIQLIQ